MSAVREQVGMEWDQRVTGAATCKIAGIAYTGSNPVPATPTLTCENAVAGRLISPSSTPAFPPVSLQPTPRRHLRRPHLGAWRRRAEYVLDQPGQLQRGLWKLMDVHALGERAAIGVAQSRGDDTGRLFLGRHRRRQRMAHQVRVGGQPDVITDDNLVLGLRQPRRMIAYRPLS